MEESAALLHQAFVGAFGAYLNEVTGEMGVELPADVVRGAVDWLSDELEQLLELPFAEQRRSPLELVQQATEGPNAHLAQQGIRAPLRDPVAVAAVPGDTYGLAPASSAALGEAAFHAHLAWGAEKARAMAPLVRGEGRTVVLVSGDLMDRSRFEEAVSTSGLRLAMWPIDEKGSTPVVAFVDLTHPEAGKAIGELAGSTRVIAYGPHVDEEALARAAQSGATEVLPRSRVFKGIAGYLPKTV